MATRALSEQERFELHKQLVVETGYRSDEGKLDRMTALIESGASVNYQFEQRGLINQFGSSPLAFALSAVARDPNDLNIKVANLLIEKGARGPGDRELDSMQRWEASLDANGERGGVKYSKVIPLLEGS